ncbi:hypothetical protein COR50_02705 [Chitinophaga caeni]|uniref:2TM domain-containing protein n=1 Tax=Chitinophaga caeni TaxID=2029983 RepID=A0A291QQJ6_9BACT|nr:2TM domain-containing protein [Chitinophaga caeni]ATL46163.1 hypothetical protein COR50_02705 [Chitinophaga caeni]
MSTFENKDLTTERLAKARASFKTHFLAYVLINSILWIAWYFSEHTILGLPWPTAVGAGWTVILVFGYCNAYPRASLETKDQNEIG